MNKENIKIFSLMSDFENQSKIDKLNNFLETFDGELEITGQNLYTQEGKILGKITDFYIDESTVELYYVDNIDNKINCLNINEFSYVIVENNIRIHTI